MIVMHKIKPAKTNPTANANPPKTTQIRFAIGCALKLVFGSFPKGKMINLASLNACKPNGIPTIVMHQIKPMKK